jgi:hypothetical protein
LLLNVLFSQEEEFAPNNQAQDRGLSYIINNPGISLIIVARDHLINQNGLIIFDRLEAFCDLTLLQACSAAIRKGDIKPDSVCLANAEL